MNTYESIFIVRPSLSDEEVKKIGEKIRGTVEKEGGSIVKSEDWGKRKLSFEVSKEKKGTYLMFQLKGPGKMVKELEKLTSVEDALIRNLIVRADPAALNSPAPASTATAVKPGDETEAGTRG